MVLYTVLVLGKFVVQHIVIVVVAIARAKVCTPHIFALRWALVCD